MMGPCCYEMPPLVVAMLTETHQHLIMSSYMALGQPGGGGRRYPRSTCFIDYKISNSAADYCGLATIKA